MSPALTASTQPGPSVGPLPETFANMTTTSSQHQYQQKYSHPDNLGMGMNQGVAPMTVFSPLTSPALRPQGGGNGHSNGTSSTPATSPQKVNHATGKIRGASKNNAKTRPSPIIRPTVDTSVGNGNSNGNGHGPTSAKALSRTSSISSSSKRQSQSQTQSQSHSAAPTPLMMSSSTFGGATSNPNQQQQQSQYSSSSSSSSQQHPAKRLSSSVPASPAFYATNMNMTNSSTSGGTPNSNNGGATHYNNSGTSASNTNTASQLGRLHETVAQTALQNSPSPHQFDLSGLTPAYTAMAQSQNQNQNQIQGQGQSQGQQLSYPFSAQFPYGQNIPQQYMQGQPQHPLPYQAQLPSNALAGSASTSMEDLMSLPSPLDLNNILSMLGQQNAAFAQPSLETSMNTYGSSEPSSAFGPSAGRGNTISNSNLQDSLSGIDQFMKDQANYQQLNHQFSPQQVQPGQFQPRHQHSASDSSIGAAAAFFSQQAHSLQQQQQQQQQQSGAEQGLLEAGAAAVAANAGKPGPLTPASFMSLPANQYTVLAGLLADHQPQSLHNVDVPAKKLNDSSISAGKQKRGKGDSTGSISKSKKQSSEKGSAAKSQTTKTGPELKKKSSTQSKLATLEEDQTDVMMDAAFQVPVASPEEMRLAINSNSTAPVSPALLAQNIKQVAAAAIAAKDAKSRAKGRGGARRKSAAFAPGLQQQDQQQYQQDLMEEDADVKPLNLDKSSLSKKQNVNGTPVLSPEKPFSLDESAAPSVYGESRPASTETSPVLAAQSDTRKSSHKVAEQRRRDSLKLCFEELRFILPPINPDEDEDFNGGPGSRRPGENNVGGQRGKNYTVDPRHPNKGISKVALLRKSNECKWDV